MNATAIRINPAPAVALLLTLAGVAAAADQPAVRAELQSTNDRKPAAEFSLKDGSGRTVHLKDYGGKVVLLDFWATWCHGCKQEIPWFAEFQRQYRKKGLAVVGVSMDEGGWKVLKPFLADAKIPYQILLGDDATFQRFGLRNLPDTLLIDRQGRVAAAYTTGLVDKDNVEANIKAMLFEH